MSGQAIVTINTDIWSVEVMSSAAELISGLSGVSSIPASTGMLFDMGSDNDNISINMAEMLFHLDIVFINSEHGVVGVLREVEPEDAAAFDAGTGYGARYFLEVNAEEAENVSVGDTVSIEIAEEEEVDEGNGENGGDGGTIQPTFWAGLMVAMVAISQIAIVGAGTYSEVKEKLKK